MDLLSSSTDPTFISFGVSNKRELMLLLVRYRMPVNELQTINAANHRKH